MEAPPPIPVLRVRGSHRDVGAQIGEASAQVIRQLVDFDAEIPAGRSRADQLTLAARYQGIVAEAMPWFMDELAGMADAADVDALTLFAVVVEEIWAEAEPGDRAAHAKCSDLVAVPPATAGGHVLVAHNNDMSALYESQLVAIEWHVDGDPTMFTIGNGVWISVGWNSAGLSLTGNALSPNDERIGVPREIQVRAMLREPTLDMMVGAALRHDRASSYNNVLASSAGEVVNVEGSATAAELTYPSEEGTLVHTNHYVCDRMLRYEGDPAYAERSATRYRRATDLLAAEPRGSITEQKLRTMLADHGNAPDSLCRHPERFGGETKTAFWCVADVTSMRIEFGRGNPCNSVAQSYAFA